MTLQLGDTAPDFTASTTEGSGYPTMMRASCFRAAGRNSARTCVS